MGNYTIKKRTIYVINNDVATNLYKTLATGFSTEKASEDYIFKYAERHKLTLAEEVYEVKGNIAFIYEISIFLDDKLVIEYLFKKDEPNDSPLSQYELDKLMGNIMAYFGNKL